MAFEMKFKVLGYTTSKPHKWRISAGSCLLPHNCLNKAENAATFLR